MSPSNRERTRWGRGSWIQQISFGLSGLDLVSYVTSKIFRPQHLEFSCPIRGFWGCRINAIYRFSTVANVLAEHSRFFYYWNVRSKSNRTIQMKFAVCGSSDFWWGRESRIRLGPQETMQLGRKENVSWRQTRHLNPCDCLAKGKEERRETAEREART